MLRPFPSVARRPARRGVILIVVLALLTLFAIVGLSFVFYADAEATSARIFREAETRGEDGPPNEFAAAAFNAALGDIIFDRYDDVGGVMSPLRGHSLTRAMYGWNGLTGPGASTP